MKDHEEQFNEIFVPLRRVTPSTNLLTQTLLHLPGESGNAPVTKRLLVRFLSLESVRVSISGIAVGLAALVLFISPMAQSINVVDELYAFEIEGEEISQELDNSEFEAEMDYEMAEIDGFDISGLEVNN